MEMKEDILRIASETERYNFHSHTQFCDGKASMREMTEGAISAGLKYYGFTPHSPINLESSCNMSYESVEEYLKEFETLKYEFGDRINLYAGMEIDFLDKENGPANDYYQKLPLDYRIGSVHFISNQKGEKIDVDGRPENFIRKMELYFEGDIRYVVETFYSQTLEMLDKGGFDIIGHFDKIGLNASHYAPGIEDESWYEHLINETIDKIAEKGVIAELNTKHYSAYGRMFPNQRYIERVKSAGIPLIVNSDAHYPHLTDASREEGLKLVKKTTNRIKRSGEYDLTSYSPPLLSTVALTS